MADAYAPLDEDGSRVEAIVKEFFDKLRAGQVPDIGALAAANPEIAEPLRQRLAALVQVFDQLQPKLQSDRRLACPHCGNPVPSIEPAAREVICGNCGSSFRVELDSTVTHRRDGMPSAIGRFEVLGLLGRGAFGEVYKARDYRLDRIVAVKIPRDSTFATPEDEQRFFREARSAAGLRHSSIVQIHEVDRDNQRPYIVSDYIEGITLADLLSGGRLSFRESAELTVHLADALDYAHRHKVIHRDIKPSNILLASPQCVIDSSDRNALMPYLADFGLARRDEGDVAITLDGQALGTPAYMSPEQAAGSNRLIDGRSDIYSLGVVLYELLTGELPFRGNQRMLLHQVIHDEPRPPRTLNDRIPRDLETICLKAMAKEPSRRYSEAGALANDLRRFLQGVPILARPAGRVERARLWCRRKPAAAGLMATAAAFIAVLLAGAGWTAVRERHFANQQLKTADKERALRGDVERALSESTSRLVQNYAANGARLLDEDDLAGSMVWNAEALKLVQGDHEREYAHRLRLQFALAASPRLLQLWTHDLEVIHAAFVPNSRLAMTAAGNKVSLHSIDTGATIGTVMEHPGRIVDAACSPDGRYIATVCEGAARLWDATNGKRLGQDFRFLEGAIMCAAISPDGEYLAGGGDGEKAQVWRISNGGLVGSPLFQGEGQGVVTRLTFSPDSGQLLVSTRGHTGYHDWVWDVASGKLISAQSPSIVNYAIGGAVWNHAGDRIVSYYRLNLDGALIWDANTGKTLAGGIADGEDVSSAQFSPDDALVATATARIFHASLSNDACVWNSTDAKRRSAPMRHQGRINSIEFSPDGAYVTTASDDKTARVWEAKTGKPICAPLYHALAVNGSTFGDDGRMLLTFSRDKTARLWDLRNCSEPAPPMIIADWHGKHARSRDGRLLALEDPRHNVAIYDLVTGDAVSTVPLPHGDGLEVLQFSPDQKLLLSGGKDQTAKLWDVRNGKAAAPPLEHTQGVFDARFSHDGRLLATHSVGWRPVSQSGHLPGELRIWDVDNGTPRTPVISTAFTVYDLEFSRDDRLLAACSSDRGDSSQSEIGVWEAKTGKEIRRTRLDRGISTLGLSPDGKLLAAASGWDFAGIRDDVLIFEIATGRLVARLPHDGSVQRVRFSPDGRRLAAASADGATTIWSTESWVRAAPTIPNSGRDDLYAEFSNDGRCIVTTDLRLWDAATAMPLNRSLHQTLHFLLLTPGGTSETHAAFFPPQAVWNPAIEARSALEWELLAEVHSGRNLDATGSLTPLQPPELAKEWETLVKLDAKKSRPPTSVGVRQWHEQEGLRQFKQQNWWSADWHFRFLDKNRRDQRQALNLAAAAAQLHLGRPEAVLELLSKMLASQPQDGSLLMTRALALVKDEKWTEAAADFTALARSMSGQTKEQAEYYYQAALCYLAAAELASYRDICEEMLQCLGEADDRSVVSRIAYTLAPGPDAIADLDRFLHLAQLSAKDFPYAARLVGAALYRSGKWDEIESQFEIARQHAPPRAWDYYFLAMTLHRQGKPERAGVYLQQGNEWWRTNYDRVPWTEQIEMRRLRREAETLILNEPGSK